MVRFSLILIVTTILLVLPIMTGVPFAPQPHAPARTAAAPPQVRGGPRGVSSSALVDASPSASVSVIDTLDLVTDHLLPGNQQPAIQASPQMVLFDAGNGNLYVRGSDGGTISVVNASTGSVLTELAVGLGGSAYIPNVATMALDAATGDLYETNPSSSSVDFIQTSTETLAGSVTVGGSPGGVVYDPTNGYLYTTNWVNGTVSVISGATHKVVTTIAVGREPGAILYDPLDNEVYVSNFESGNVSILNATRGVVVANPVTGSTGSEPVALTLNTQDDLINVVNALTSNITVINGTTNAATASLPVGSIPTSATFSPSTDRLLVANGASNNVTVLQQPGNSAIASIAIGHGAQGAALDPTNGYVYIADYSANTVSIIDPANNSLVGTVTTNNGPEDLAADSQSGAVYVANLGSAHSDTNLTVISPTSSASIGSIPLVTYPTSVTAAPNGNVYATDYGGLGAYVVNANTNLVTGIVPSNSPEPSTSAWDSATGDLYFVSEGTGTLNVISGTGSTVATLAMGFGADGLAYDGSNGDVYVSNYYSGNVTLVDGSTRTVSSAFTVKSFDSLGAELFDPMDSAVYVADYSDHNVTVVNGAVTNGSIQVGSDPSSLAYDAENDTIFVANYGSDNISVIDASTNRVAGSFSAYFPEYVTYDPATNALYMASSENGQVVAYNASTYVELGSPIELNSSVASGGIAYSATSGDVYVSKEYDGSLAILSNASPSTYPVTFTESGLAPGTSWTVTLGGSPNSSSGNQIGFAERNGTYPYVVGSVPGYAANTSSGDVPVAGAGHSIFVGFTVVQTAGTYPVTFNETGLPDATPWQVTLTPAGAAGSPSADAPSSIVFEAPNNTYSFTIPAVSGYTASPSSGSVAVAGQPQYRTITFSGSGSPVSLIVSLAADPGSLTLGSSVTFTSTVSGGSPGYSYVYSALPTGCLTVNAAVLDCTPNETGTFTVVVNVTDQAGNHASAHATVQVVAGAPSSSGGGSNSSTFDWWILAVVVILVLVILFAVWWRRRRKAASPTPPAAG